ncbi:cell division protein ZipA [sulfur-oxidizing endosymbiont of Gigantopelta aegis]|uniref:cell division protein ZipA n=1 Tax=sulfur-oxidizing endosymbiont of Gigantopelta aegis TaxID=2794934 RepID=UPI0018DC981F|nr:cell division protein ZipA [sulfur-oxidizing endosymbiont of Gigantopelta aegis]
MDELTFLLILAGIGVVLLVAMFTYYKHHKKISDEIKDFNHHGHEIDDVLLDEQINKDDFLNDEFPDSFSANRKDDFDIDDVHLKNDSFEAPPVKPKQTQVLEKEVVQATIIVQTPVTETPIAEKAKDERELVDGVYINSKRVIKTGNTAKEYVSKTYIAPEKSAVVNKTEVTSPTASSVAVSTSKPETTKAQSIKIYYDPVPEGVEELIISHTILARGQHFNGEQLFKALESAGLCYGEMDIYHYPGNEEQDSFALFSVANVVEPGTFNPQEAAALNTPGISMFMRLPTRIPSYEAYEEFIHVAQIIAADLEGELCDETRSQLTQQAISYKKEQIRKLNFDMAKAEKLAANNA